MSNKRKEKQKELKLTALDLADENPELEQGLEVLARLLLKRWEAKHTEEEAETEEGN